MRQADVRPRDVIGVDVEDFAGTGPYSPTDRSQTTAWYERTWERGGKREARVGSARSELEVAQQRGRPAGSRPRRRVSTASTRSAAPRSDARRPRGAGYRRRDRKSTRLNSSH